MIFQGIRTSIAKEPYIFVIFQGGPNPLSPPLDPHMYCIIHVPIPLEPHRQPAYARNPRFPSKIMLHFILHDELVQIVTLFRPMEISIHLLGWYIVYIEGHRLWFPNNHGISNSAVPDEMPHDDLHCLPVYSFRGFWSTVVPTKSDSDVLFCFQLLSKTLICTLHLS